MATLVLAAAGAAVGSSIGGTLLGLSAEFLGGFIGASLGSRVDAELFGGERSVEGPRLKDLAVQSSAYGAPIPLVYGTMRLAGNIIWSSGLKETRHERKSSVGGGKGGGGQTVTQTSYSYSASLAVAVAGRPIQDIGRIWADGKLLRDSNGDLAAGGTLRIYRGSEAQFPDPLIEAEEGIGNVSAHRGLAYVVFEDLQLGEYANRIPNLTFEVIADSGGTVSLQTAVEDLAARAALEAVNAGDLDQTVKGFAVNQPGAARAAIQALAKVYAFDVAEVDGELHFSKRPGAVSASVPEADLGGHLAGAGRDAKFTRRRVQELELPGEVAIRHIDPDRDYQLGAQRARKLTTQSPVVETLDVPIVLNASDAKRTAETRLAQIWNGRERVRFALLPKYAALAPGDVVTVVTGMDTHRVRVDEADFAGFVTCHGTREAMNAFTSTAVAEGGIFPMQAVLDPGVTNLELMNLPVLVGADVATPAFYAAAAGASDGWDGAVLYVSEDGEISYQELTVLPVPAVMGQTTTALGSGPAAYWDEGNSLNVQLLRADMTLESHDPLTVLSGRNAALIGSEIVQFRDAVLEADGSYTLTGLLRGRRGTEWAMSGHGTGERFVLLEEGALARIEIDLGAIGKPYDYKPVSRKKTLAGTPSEEFSYTGANLIPFSPVHPKGERNDSGDLTVRWVRRTRVGGAWRDGADVPVGEESEAYEIDIMNGAAVVRSLTTTQPEATYTAAEQTDDFGAPQSTIEVKIYQVSAAVGRGRALEVSL